VSAAIDIARKDRSPIQALLPRIASVVAWLVLAGPAGAESARLVPPPQSSPALSTGTTETAVLAGGCFWGVQGVFQHVVGVTSAVSGYAGGTARSANYADVGTGRTGHAESVQITFDPRKISYGRLLQIYFSVAHDPTELNRQGPDSGPQYRSTIFPVNPGQAQVANAYVEQINRTNIFGKRLATTVQALEAFYPAEAYHQDFLTLHPGHPYIVFNDLPKVDNLKRLFPTDYSAKPVLVGAASGS
jgi:peptide-methionine (S)-S-oxide reductase